MPKITPKLNICEGDFDTDTGMLACVSHNKTGHVSLCFKGEPSGFIEFAKIKLYSSGTYMDSKATQADATILGEEIANRWNMHQAMKTLLLELIDEHGERDSDSNDDALIHPYDQSNMTIAKAMALLMPEYQENKAENT